MPLNRAVIGKALEKAGVTGDQAERAEKEILRGIGIIPWEGKAPTPAWTYPAHTIKAAPKNPNHQKKP